MKKSKSDKLEFYKGKIAVKNKKIRLIIAIVFVLIAALTIWYFMPTTFLSKVNPSDIKSISVFDGNTGESFDFSDRDEIRYVAENIQSTKMKKRYALHRIYGL